MLFLRSINRLLTLCLALVVFSVSSKAQSPGASIKITSGDEFKIPNYYTDEGLIGNDQEGYLQVAYHRLGKVILFQRYDSSLHMTGKSEVKLKSLLSNFESVAFTQVGNKYYWFYSTYSKKKNEETLYAWEINLQQAKMTGAARALVTTTRLGTNTNVSDAYGIVKQDKWMLYYSPDSSKLLVQYRLKPDVRNDSKSYDMIGVHVFDTELNKVWGREVAMPYTEKQMDNGGYHVGKDGSVYALTTVYDEEKDNGKTPNYRTEILKWVAGDDQTTKIPFRLGNRFVSAIWIVRGVEDELLVAGYYSNKPYSNSSDGVFLLHLDEKGGQLTNFRKGFYEFPESVLSQFESSRTRRKNERKDEKDNLEISNLRLRNVVVSEDGSIQIYGEEAYVLQLDHTSQVSSMSGIRFYSYYKDILGMCIGANGELKWIKKISKDQGGETLTVGNWSFKLFTYGKDQYIFFMDYDSKGLAAVKIDENGNDSKSIIHGSKDKFVNVAVVSLKKIGTNRMIGKADGRNLQPIFISFE